MVARRVRVYDRRPRPRFKIETRTAPPCQPVKKNLPGVIRVITMHAGSGRTDIRESFRAEIVVPIKRNALHFETVCALLACGKGVDALAVCAQRERRG